jgi:hypothetical protein
MGDSREDADQGWLDEVEELRLRESLASQMGGPENLARHRAAGRLNVRERRQSPRLFKQWRGKC